MCLSVRDEHIRHTLAAAAAIFALWPATAIGQSCGLLTVIENRLEKEYGELPVVEWNAAVPEGALPVTLRLYTSPDTGSTTLLSLVSRGSVMTACLVATGDGFRTVKQKDKLW